jgi:protein TonB
MFEQATLSNPNASRRAWTTGLGFAGEAALVALIALVPIIWPKVLPKPQALLTLLTPPASVPPPTAVVVKPHTTSAPIQRLLFTMPRSIPATIAKVVDEPPEVVGAVPGVSHAVGDPNGLLTAILNDSARVLKPPAMAKPPEARPQPEPTAPRRIRTSSIELARLIRRIEPAYPAIAKLAHVSGTVELSALVGTDGRIREVKAISGNPLLIKAAVDAVSQWIYAPPILNGEPVEVIAPITVNFRLDH